MWKNRLFALSFGLLICLVALGLAEIFYAVLDHNTIPNQTYSSRVTYVDSDGITRARPSQTYHVTKQSRKTGDLIYDIDYSVDYLSRRVTPVQNPETRSKHLLFFGCSYVYGEGLKESETLPFKIGESELSFKPYNYAYHGHSASQMYTKLKSRSLLREVPETSGALIYVFMNEHVNRAAGFMRVATTWGRHHPYYQLSAKGEIIYKGTFSSSRPVLKFLYGILNRSYLLAHYNIDFPFRVNKKHFALTARLIEESEKLYREQFPSGKFYMVIYPGSDFGTKVRNELKNKSVIVLDHSELFSANDPRYYLHPEDKHPNPLAIQVLSEQLLRDLAL